MPKESIGRVAVIGTGLIGGSLALGIKSRGLAGSIVGFDSDPEHAQRALQLGVIDETATSSVEAVSGADLVIIATPVRSIPSVFSDIAPSLKPGSLVTDVGSTKSGIMRAAEESLPAQVNFVGGHPMAGSELDGVEAADAELFVNRCYVLTPGRNCSPDAFPLLHGLLRNLGALTVAMDAELHDRAVAIVSHLPHLLALSLMDLALRKQQDTANLFYLAAGGFRDMTRIAASNPAIWMDILSENRETLESLIDEYAAELARLKRLISEQREEELRDYMEGARRGRLNLSPALGGITGEVFTIIVPVQDRPGVISEITLAVGELGVNIEDLELVHPLESGGGLLQILVKGRDSADSAVNALVKKGFQARLAPGEGS